MIMIVYVGVLTKIPPLSPQEDVVRKESRRQGWEGDALGMPLHAPLITLARTGSGRGADGFYRSSFLTQFKETLLSQHATGVVGDVSGAISFLLPHGFVTPY